MPRRKEFRVSQAISNVRGQKAWLGVNTIVYERYNGIEKQTTCHALPVQTGCQFTLLFCPPISSLQWKQLPPFNGSPPPPPFAANNNFRCLQPPFSTRSRPDLDTSIANVRVEFRLPFNRIRKLSKLFVYINRGIC